MRLFLSYLNNRTQRIKIGLTFSDQMNIVNVILQGSILSLILNVFINDLFFSSAKCEICYFAYDNSLYSCGMNLDNIFTNLTQDTWNVCEWFVYNSMKAYPENFQFIIFACIANCRYNHKINLICYTTWYFYWLKIEF